MDYKVRYTSKFKKQYKLAIKQGKNINLLKEVVDMLKMGLTLPTKYDNHKLINDWAGYWECHLEFDWLLVYCYDNDQHMLVLSRTGSHTTVFD